MAAAHLFITALSLLGLLGLCAPAAAAPLQVRAERLEIRAHAACAQHIEAHALRLERADAQLRATQLTGCLGEQLTLSQIQLEAPRLRLSAERARWRWGEPLRSLRAEQIRLSTCGCADPPWHVRAERVTVHPEGHLEAHWASFWWGPIPLLFTPWLSLPTQRRSGLLLPQLAYDGQLGLSGRLPLYWAPHRGVDLTLSPGWRGRAGPSADAEVRWAHHPHDRGRLRLHTLPLRGLWIESDGGLDLGGARWALEGQLSTDPHAQPRTALDFWRRALDHQRLRLGAHTAHRRWAAGAQLLSRRDLRPSASATQPLSISADPGLWLRLSQPIHSAVLQLSSQLWQRDLFGEEPRPEAHLDLALRHRQWWGPLSLRSAAGLQTQHDLAQEIRREHWRAWAAAEAQIAAARHWGALTHTLALALDGRLAAGAGRPTDPGPQPTPSLPGAVFGEEPAGPTLGLSLINRVQARERSAELRLRASAEGLSPPWRVEPLQWQAEIELSFANLQGAYAGLTLFWGDLRLGPTDTVHLLGGLRRLQAHGPHPWLRASPFEASWALSDPTQIDQWSAGIELPLSNLEWAAHSVFQMPSAAQPQGHWQAWWATVGWRGRCDCWQIRIRAGQERTRRRPDLALEFALSGL